MLHSFASWLGTTSLSRAIMDTAWVWPAAEVLHFVGLSLLIGVAGTFDLRLMGFLRAIPLAALHGMTRWAVVGFVINIVTGSLFFIGTPLQYIQNSAFAWKMAFVGIAAGNALIFERLLAARTLATPPGDTAPFAARVVGAASLVSWLLVLYWGRMLAFAGNAF